MAKTFHTIKYVFYLLIIVVGTLCTLPLSVRASTVFFSSEQQFPVMVDTQFEVKVILNTEGNSINAIEGEFVYDDEALEIVGINDGSTIITSWIERPTISGSSVTFSGIMAGGFETAINPLTEERLNGEIFSIKFRSGEPSKTELYFTRGQVYKNDGLGSVDQTTLYPFEINVSKDGRSGLTDIVDTERPLVFYPEISTNEYIYDGKYFLVFSTTDKESGINHFEVKEGRSDWKIAESPYLLEDQSLRSYIRIKAIDNSGNVRLAQVHSEQFFPVSIFIIPIVIVIGILSLFFIYFPRKFKKIKVQ